MRIRTLIIAALLLGAAGAVLGGLVRGGIVATLLAGLGVGSLAAVVLVWLRIRAYRREWGKAPVVSSGGAAKDDGVDSSVESEAVFSCRGFCPICEQDVEFSARFDWFRDHLLCSSCGSIPRERALMRVIQSYCPGWRDLRIHESSPAARGASRKLSEQCKGYLSSQYFPGVDPGTVVRGMRCENLEAMSFADGSIDLHVTQDVLEHVFDPRAVFREVERTLAPGGMHIFTVPLVNKASASRWRARLVGGEVQHLQEESYHGNPVGDGRSLVTIDWGFDIASHILEACGMQTEIHCIDDISQGIRAEYIEVLVSRKPHHEVSADHVDLRMEASAP